MNQKIYKFANLTLLVLFFISSFGCELFIKDEISEPVEISTHYVYIDEVIEANQSNTYKFSLLSNEEYRIDVSHLTSNCDVSVYEYNSSNILDDQELIAYSKKSGIENEEVSYSFRANVEYLIIVEEKDNAQGTYWLYLGV